MLPPSRKIEKLKVIAYDKPARSGTGQTFTFFIHPEQMGSRHQNRFMKRRGINTSGRSAEYAFSYSDELSVELLLDNTVLLDKLPGLNPANLSSVKEQVDMFLRQCFHMDGKLHEPRFLVVEWGEMVFECRLKSVEIAYHAFDDQGKAHRASLQTVFVQDLDRDKRLRLENKQSPDITHSRLIREGDTLTALCKEIYGDPSEYIRVAAANRLNHFRALTVGSTLHFPPIEK